MQLTSGAIPLLEESVHLLRRAPRTTLLCHLLGATPFALSLLLFWNDVTNPHTSDATVGRDSIVLALLLLWMNCWRAVFAGRLRRLLSASSDTPWTWRRTWNLVAGQAFLGATKLVVLPLSLLTIFGFAWTVAFYRSATALADRAELDPAQLIARARRLASLDRRQSWLILPTVGFLWLLFTANLGLTLALLPELIRALTGYESQFSLSGGYYIFTPLFLWATLAISWIIFDPFIQTVYCLRSFHGESITTAEDIRAGLRTLTTAAAILLVLVPLHAFANVPPAQLEHSVRQAMRSSEYDGRLPAAPHNVPWLVRVTDRLIDGIKSTFHAIGKAIEAFFDWLRKVFEAPGPPHAGSLPTAGLHWWLYALMAFVLFLAGWLLPHGSVEIPAILLGGQGGFILAGALIGWGGRTSRPDRLRAIAPDLFAIVAGAAAMLVWAGMVEAFISQYHKPVIPYGLKIAFGVCELAVLTTFLGWAGRE